ncbi:hypothetical protein HPP92_024090 [Vanilla planifolia]|uniref:Reverse transcriptase domain-containing protein n=1 Tax=Vanilla planifolia TaxID=51239 RepID=A0A835PLC0_VANPL|nr:hypothetical protein HPP92_024090 [Vanilla planifolia]
MWFNIRLGGTSKLFRPLLMRGASLPGPKSEKMARLYGARISLEYVEDVPKQDEPPASLAKSLACLPDEPQSTENQQATSFMEQKRLIELRIKKRVKAQYHNDKFYELMDTVVANKYTLSDCYDLVRLTSHIELTSEKDQICFSTMAEQLEKGEFDVAANTVTMRAKGDKMQFLVLPNLKLRVVQESLRVVLEVVFRPHFSKLSHGCRNGRGHRSALRYVKKKIHSSDWWFTVSMNKEADIGILSKLTSFMEERIQDTKLFQFIRQIFDAGALNLVFGVFPKGHGLPQEGVLSPILMNIYLNAFDKEVFRISLRYEALGLGRGLQHSNLRGWFRRQMNDSEAFEGVKLNVCRYMDEVLVFVSGSKDVATSFKFEMTNFLRDSLHLTEAENQMDPVAADDNCLQFLGMTVQVRTSEGEAVRAVHKLKDKVRLFASQKQEIWNSLTLRLGKKWLAYGLRRLKESEIKQLGLSTPILDHISRFRKPGMKTDHWFKELLKLWMQDVNAKKELDVEAILSKYITEPGLPQELKDSFYNFIKQANEYVSSESAATLALLKSSKTETNPSQKVLRMKAPVSKIKKSLLRYGIVTAEGYPRHVSTLVLQDDDQIISWFLGLVYRWRKWYSETENYDYIKLLMTECLRKSCSRTLGAKYQVAEEVIEKRFDATLSCIPMAEDLDAEMCLDGLEEGLCYGAWNSGLCSLSLSRVRVPTRSFSCFVMGCTSPSRSMYTLHVKERQRFPGWKTGFVSSIHPALHRERIGLCNRHVEALYLGKISLQSVQFGALRR